MAIAEGHLGVGYSSVLVSDAVRLAASIAELFLMTITAKSLFERYGY